MRLVLISDTHERHHEVTLPEGDILIHAGDYTIDGHKKAKDDFFKWFLKQPHEYKVLIAGNHDFGEPWETTHLGDKEYYLCDGMVLINGLRIWGSPYTPEFGGWAFMYPRPTKRWLAIPSRRGDMGVDVLVTHGPPMGTLDRPYGKGQMVGCSDLAAAIPRVQPRLHVFGHIHGGYGIAGGADEGAGTIFVNASICDERYEPVNKPVVIDLEPLYQIGLTSSSPKS